MAIFQFLFYLGIINIIFRFLWKWIFVLPLAILFAVLKFDYGMRFIKVFGIYLMVSLTALLTLGFVAETPTILSLIFYPLIGAFVIFMGLASSQHETRKQAYQTGDYELMRIIERDAGFEAIILIGAVIFYIFALFIPAVSSNSLIELLFKVIQWIYSIPVIGWIIGIGGVLFLLTTIFHGIFAFGAMMIGIFGKFKKEKPTNEVISVEVEQNPIPYANTN
jgi:hypothetical protein